MFRIHKHISIPIWRWFDLKINLVLVPAGKSIMLQKHLFVSKDWRFLFGKGMAELGSRKDRLRKFGNCKFGFYIPPKEWHKFTAVEPSLILEIRRHHR